MAINFTVSYTFAPNTTIASSQVNTNTSDVANVFNGLEALTKSFAKLKVDVDPTTALEVSTKQYVDHYSTWRRPNLNFGSVTTVSLESGLNGTSGSIPMLFPDGSVRTETSTTRTTFDITRNAVLTTSGAQSGLRATLSEANNTWYALYAVKVTDSTTQWCTVGDTTLPVQASYATLNTNFGTNGWVYLGLIRNGDNSGVAGDILNFCQSGSHTMFVNTLSTNAGSNALGVRLATTASGTSLNWTYDPGTGAAQVPSTIKLGYLMACTGNAATQREKTLTVNTLHLARMETPSGRWYSTAMAPLILGFECTSVTTAVGLDLVLTGFIDPVLGVGSNPLL